MGFPAFLKQMGKNIFGVVNRVRNSPSFEFLGSPDREVSTSPKVIIKQFKKWIYTCCMINAGGVAQAKLRLYGTTAPGQSKEYLFPTKDLSSKRYNWLVNESNVKGLTKINTAEEIVEITDHPALTLLESVNSFHNYFETMESTSIYLDMIGDSYWYINMNKELGIPEDLWVLQSQYMTIVPGQRVYVKGYLYGETSPGTEPVKFTPKEIIHFKTPNPNDFYYGLGCAQAEAQAIDRMDMLDKSENSALRNMARPDFLVQYKGGQLDKPTHKDLMKQWNKAYAGPNKTGKVQIMDQDFDIKTLSFKPNEMEYLSGRVQTLKEIAGAFSIPYSLLDTTDTKKATSDRAEYWHSKNGITPRLRRIEQKLNEKLIPLYDDRLFVAFDSVIPENIEVQTSTNAIYLDKGVLSVNEVRRELGLPPYKDAKFDEPFAGGIGEAGETSNSEFEEVVEVDEE